MAQNGKSELHLRLACEVAPDRVVVARSSAGHDFVEALETRTLAKGAVVPSLTATNVHDVAALREAVSGALASVSDRSRDLVLVLPDAAVRVFLLDFEEMPEDLQEIAGVVRFRLRKSLPFEIERAAVSFHVQRDASGVRVVAAVALSEVVQEYEAAVRELGYNPGVVVPSSIAALGVVEGSRPTLVLKMEAATTAVAILDAGQVRLFRVLDHPEGLDLEQDLAREIYPSLVFFQDTYAAHIERVLVGGAAVRPEVGPLLEAHTGTKVEQLISTRHIGPALSGTSPAVLAGVAGALVQ